LFSFEPFRGQNAWDGIFGASLGLLGIGIGSFVVSNSSKLSAEGMKPGTMCYMIGFEVTHMLGDGACGRASCELGLCCSQGPV